MFREVKLASQKPGQHKRRWFSGSEMDLFVWVDENHEVVSYQLSYDKPHAEKALAWDKDKGFTHHGVDDGQQPGKYPGSPLLVRDGALNLPKLIYLIDKNFGDLIPDIKSFIVNSIIKNFD